MFVVSYEMKIEDINKTLDGFVIPGGRDLNPKFYNQEDKGSNLEEESLKRYPIMKNFYQNMKQDIPILAICWGF